MVAMLPASSGDSPQDASRKEQRELSPVVPSTAAREAYALDSRPQTRRRGKCASLCLSLVVLLLLAALGGIAYGLYLANAHVQQPHREMFVKAEHILPGPRPESSKGFDQTKMHKLMFGTSEEQKALKNANLGKDLHKTWEDDVVRPLFNAHTRFDVHATLWLKWTEENDMVVSDEQRARHNSTSTWAQNINSNAAKESMVEYSDFQSDRLEHLQPVWSGIVARHLSLGSTKHSTEAEIDIDLSALPLLDAETVKSSTLAFTAAMVPSALDDPAAPWHGLNFTELVSADGLFSGDSVWEESARLNAWKRPSMPSSAHLQAKRLCKPTMVESSWRAGSEHPAGKAKHKQLLGWNCHLWQHSRQANSTLGTSKHEPTTLAEALHLTGTLPKSLIALYERIEDPPVAHVQDRVARVGDANSSSESSDAKPTAEEEQEIARLLGETVPAAKDVRKTVAALLMTRCRIMLPKIDEQAVFRLSDLQDKQGPSWGQYFKCVGEGASKCIQDSALSPFHQHFTFTAPDGSLRHFYAPQMYTTNGDAGARETVRLFDHLEHDDIFSGPREVMKNASQVHQDRLKDWSEDLKSELFAMKLFHPFANIQDQRLSFKWKVRTQVSGPITTHLSKLGLSIDAAEQIARVYQAASNLPTSQADPVAGNTSEQVKSSAIPQDNVARESYAQELFLKELHQWEEIQAWLLMGDGRRHLTLLSFASTALEMFYGVVEAPLSLVYWLTRRTSYGLSGAAGWLYVMESLLVGPFQVSFFVSIEAEGYSFSWLQRAVEILLPILVAALFSLSQAFPTFRITFVPWRRSSSAQWNKKHHRLPYTLGLLGRRKADQAERRSERLDLAYVKALLLAVALCALHILFGNVQLTTGRGYPEGYFSAHYPPHLGHLPIDVHKQADAPESTRRWRLALETLSVSCTSAAAICQLLLNGRSKTYNGSFRIVEILSATKLLLHWLHSAFAAEDVMPYTVRCIVADAIVLLACAQAVLYRGARQDIHLEELEE